MFNARDEHFSQDMNTTVFSMDPDVVNPAYSEEDKPRFRKSPEAILAHRKRKAWNLISTIKHETSSPGATRSCSMCARR